MSHVIKTQESKKISVRFEKFWKLRFFLSIAIIVALFFQGVFSFSPSELNTYAADEGAESPEMGSYQSYKDSASSMCYSREEEETPPWNDKTTYNNEELPEELISIPEIFYPDLYSPNANTEFQKAIQAVNGSNEELEVLLQSEAQDLPLGSQIEKASLLYKERMNSIFACAVLNTKLVIHDKLIENFRPAGSNIVRRLEQSSRQIQTRMKLFRCLNVSDVREEWSDDSLSPSLIRSATIEYCNYRYYLSYVDFNIRNNLGAVISAEEKLRKWTSTSVGGSGSEDPKKTLDRFPSTERLANSIANAADRAASEIAHTRAVYDEAFESYRDFEKHYASHVLMVLIEDRYLLLREYLRDTMNPIGQVLYKASNATSPGE